MEKCNGKIKISDNYYETANLKKKIFKETISQYHAKKKSIFKFINTIHIYTPKYL